MNELTTQQVIELLGWTLLHSLWQGLLIYLLLIGFRKLTPSLSPASKYAGSTIALVLMVAVPISTFFFLLPVAGSFTANLTTTWTVSDITQSVKTETASLLAPMMETVNSWLPSVVTGWIVGMCVFGFRLVAAWYYTVRLRVDSFPVSGDWACRLRELASGFGINKEISLAESNRVDAPLLLGYLKPIILLPIGMISGLSSEHVESVLLHELAHIRRHDFAINFVQSIIEVIFFFNPFIWIVSAQIRSDRELCCDDQVVSVKSPLIYAQALRQLAEVQSTGSAFSLGITGSKNKLLHRIKRIMKTTTRSEDSRGKMIPAILMTITLAAASWVSIQAARPKGTFVLRKAIVAVDTVKKDKEKKSATYSRKSVTTYDRKGEPQTETSEVTEGDDELLRIAPIAVETPEIADLPDLAIAAEMAELARIEAFDTVVAPVWAPILPDIYDQNLSEVERVLEQFNETTEQLNAEELHEVAATLDRLRQDQLQQRSARTELQRQRNLSVRDRKMNLDDLHQGVRLKAFEKVAREFEQVLAEQMVKDGYVKKGEKLNSLHWEDNNAIKINGIAIKKADEEKYRAIREMFQNARVMERQSSGMREMNEALRRQQEYLRTDMREQASRMSAMHRTMKQFETALTEELIKDGYLGKDEEIKSLNLDDHGDITVNGKKVKPADLPKYRELRERYRSVTRGRSE